MKILVSKPGINVLTATSPNDFYLNSDYPLLKIHSYGTFWGLVGSSVTIYHNLGYKPYVIVFSTRVDPYDAVTTEWYQHDWAIEGATTVWIGTTKIYNDRIVITVDNTSSFRAIYHGFYYIFIEEA